MPYDDGLSLDDLSEETSIYAKPEDGEITLLGQFSDKQAVYDAVDDTFEDYVGRIVLFTSLGARTRPRPFETADANHKSRVEQLVEQLEQSEYLAEASPASPGGVTHVTRLDYKVAISATDYDFSCQFTPDEPDVDTDGYDRPDKLANTFDAICDSALDDADYEVEFVAGDTYIPRRGAQHHNTRLYGRLVPTDPPLTLVAARAFRDQPDVADAFTSYQRQTPDISWVMPDGSRSLEDVSYDLGVILDEPREPIRATDVEDYDIRALSSIPFEREEIVKWGEPLIATVARETDIDLSLAGVGIHSYYGSDMYERPLLGVAVHSDPDD